MELITYQDVLDLPDLPYQSLIEELIRKTTTVPVKIELPNVHRSSLDGIYDLVLSRKPIFF